MLRSRQVDGIILASAHGSENADLLRQLTSIGTAIVMIDRDDHPKLECHRVLTDDERVGMLAATHLLEVGRRSIAHIGGLAITHAKRREKGWRDVLAAKSVEVPAEWFVQAGFMESDGYRADALRL